MNTYLPGLLYDMITYMSSDDSYLLISDEESTYCYSDENPQFNIDFAVQVSKMIVADFPLVNHGIKSLQLRS